RRGGRSVPECLRGNGDEGLWGLRQPAGLPVRPPAGGGFGMGPVLRPGSPLAGRGPPAGPPGAGRGPQPPGPGGGPAEPAGGGHEPDGPVRPGHLPPGGGGGPEARGGAGTGGRSGPPDGGGGPAWRPLDHGPGPDPQGRGH